MGLNVISNFAASVAHRNLVQTDAQATASLAKLSSGSRVVSARDDAAALAIGSRIRAEVEGLKQASVNAGQAISLLQIAEGAAARVSDILVRMKTLAVQAGSGQLSSTERAALDTEYQALLSEIDRIAQDTEFNGQTLINGSSGTSTVINSQSDANNLIQTADGFQSIVFDGSVGDASILVSFDSATNVLTLTDLTNGTSQGVDIGSAAIAQNETQDVRFDTIGVTVTLNEAFDKTTDIKPTGSATTAGGSIDASTITLTGASASDPVETLSSLTATIDAATASAATMALGSFTANSIDLSSTGTKTVTLSDGSGSNFTVQFTVTNAFSDGNNGTVEVDDLGTLVFGNTNSSTTTDFTFKLGTGTATQDQLSVSVDSLSVAALGLTGTSVSGSDSTNADNASGLVSTAVNSVNSARANLGASQNRLDFATANLATAIENQEAARSQLLDLDIALEITTFTSKQILLQTGVSMLAQANQLPQNLLRLFQ